MMPFVFCSDRGDVDKSDFMHFVTFDDTVPF